jgi:uncharacterized repeat protein (TIGR03987 family)
MPVNIMVGLVSLLVALVSYSIGVWGAFRAKRVERKHLVWLWMGFLFDVLATAMMALQIGGLDLRPGTPLLHTVLALLGMVGMLAAAALGTWALLGGKDEVRASVPRWALAPWAIWVFVFVWGMIDRGAARIGG